MVLEGPPGLAFGAALGMAIAERTLAARFGRSLVDHRIWLLAEPRDLVSGTAQEAAPVAGALTLGRLAVLVRLQADQPALRAGFTAAGWTVRVVPAGKAEAADTALKACLRAQKPSLVLQIGPQADPPPEAPGPSIAEKRGIGARRAWLKRLRRHTSNLAFQHALSGHLAPGWQKYAHVEDPAPAALPSTENAVSAAIGRLAGILPDLAFLPAFGHGAFPAPPGAALSGGLASWDGRDLAAAASLLGMALHGGIVPVSSASSDLAAWTLPALRAAAARRVRWLHILSGGQDSALPAIPNLHIYRPADAAEALDCLVLALRRTDGPSLLLVSPAPYTKLPPATPHLCARGAYLVHAPPRRDLTLLAAGAGLAIALRVHGELAAQGLHAALVSMPCRAVFDHQDAAYRRLVLPGKLVAITTGQGGEFAGLTGPDDLVLDATAAPGGAAILAAMILRHLHGGLTKLEV